MRVQCSATIWSGARCSRWVNAPDGDAGALCGIHRAAAARGRPTRRVACPVPTASPSLSSAARRTATKPGPGLLRIYGWSPKRGKQVRVRKLTPGDVYLDEEDLPVLVERLSKMRVWGRYIWQDPDDVLWFNVMGKNDFVWLAERPSRV